MKKKKGLTLAELLVVGIVFAVVFGIAIAGPTIHEKRIRYKVLRAKADMRSIGCGGATYCVDIGYCLTHYRAPDRGPVNYAGWANKRRESVSLRMSGDRNALNTPVAYLTSVADDPFRLYGQRDRPSVLFDY